ncbi:MAG: hypothetical protein AB2385_03440 [Symbiobacterium sp.]|uniref:hypothetical protein n=1 Tax=Symbiobacterium sp. TaxID=1971213 RepID=UPI00346405B4
MKMELVEQELRTWGEILITTSGGQHFEIHLGDTEFDRENRVIRLKSPQALFVIDGDSVETIQKHYGHLDND